MARNHCGRPVGAVLLAWKRHAPLSMLDGHECDADHGIGNGRENQRATKGGTDANFFVCPVVPEPTAMKVTTLLGSAVPKAASTVPVAAYDMPKR